MINPQKLTTYFGEQAAALIKGILVSAVVLVPLLAVAQPTTSSGVEVPQNKVHVLDEDKSFYLTSPEHTVELPVKATTTVEVEEVEDPVVVEPEDKSHLSDFGRTVVHAVSNKPGVSYTANMHRYNNIFVAKANEYGVSYSLIKAISLCENVRQDPTLQSGLYYNFSKPSIGIIKGEREYSFGIVQINLHYNPNVTYEQATDPVYSIDFLAKNVAAGRHSMWGCYTNGGYLKYM